MGCNLLGIVLGFYFIDKFGLERYKWSLRTAPMKNSLWSNIKYFWTNWNLKNLETKAFASVKKYLQMTWFVVFIQVNDLALFFLKYIYQIPTNNWMILFRTFLVGFLCVNAAKEYYRFVSEKEREIKINCFMVNMIVFTEWFIVYKHGANDFDHAFIGPLGKVFLWGLFALFMVFFIKITISDIVNFKEKYLNKNHNI